MWLDLNSTVLASVCIQHPTFNIPSHQSTHLGSHKEGSTPNEKETTTTWTAWTGEHVQLVILASSASTRRSMTPTLLLSFPLALLAFLPTPTDSFFSLARTDLVPCAWHGLRLADATTELALQLVSDWQWGQLSIVQSLVLLCHLLALDTSGNLQPSFLPCATEQARKITYQCPMVLRMCNVPRVAFCSKSCSLKMGNNTSG